MTPETPTPSGELDVRAKRAYDPVEDADGYRVLIDHVWPRGVARTRARLDDWARELAPSDELRKWFDHDPARFAEFRARYRDELADQSERLDQLRRRAASGPLTHRLRRPRPRAQQRRRAERAAPRWLTDIGRGSTVSGLDDHEGRRGITPGSRGRPGTASRGAGGSRRRPRMDASAPPAGRPPHGPAACRSRTAA